jgi:hypothetical protein
MLDNLFELSTLTRRFAKDRPLPSRTDCPELFEDGIARLSYLQAWNTVTGRFPLADAEVQKRLAVAISTTGSRLAREKRALSIDGYAPPYGAPLEPSDLLRSSSPSARTDDNSHPATGPYVCIFIPCETPYRHYLTRKEWERHVETEHMVSTWICPARGHESDLVEFKDRSAIEDHMVEVHGIDRSGVSYLAKSCERRPSIPRPAASATSVYLAAAVGLVPAGTISSTRWPTLASSPRNT